MLVNMKDLLKKAQEGSYAVGSFSIANMEMILGVIKAAEEMKSPIILQIAEVRLNHSPLKIIGPTMLAAAKNAAVPVAVHLDHGTTLGCIKEALELGFTSVMFDGSHLPFEENVKITKEVVALAKKYGAATEAEIGCVGGSEDGSVDIAMRCTSPSQAKEFYAKVERGAVADTQQNIQRAQAGIGFDQQHPFAAAGKCRAKQGTEAAFAAAALAGSNGMDTRHAFPSQNGGKARSHG